jgi:hypothetical protein
MKTAVKKQTNGLTPGDISSEIDVIVEHVEKNRNCEFIRILEQCSKMDVMDKKKFLEFAKNL